MDARQQLLSDICTFGAAKNRRLRPTKTNDKSWAITQVNGEKIKDFSNVNPLVTVKSEPKVVVVDEVAVVSGPTPKNPPDPPNLTLQNLKDFKLGSNDKNGVKKTRLKTKTCAEPALDRNALMNDIKAGNFKLRKTCRQALLLANDDLDLMNSNVAFVQQEEATKIVGDLPKVSEMGQKPLCHVSLEKKLDETSSKPRVERNEIPKIGHNCKEKLLTLKQKQSEIVQNDTIRVPVSGLESKISTCETKYVSNGICKEQNIFTNLDNEEVPSKAIEKINYEKSEVPKSAVISNLKHSFITLESPIPAGQLPKERSTYEKSWIKGQNLIASTAERKISDSPSESTFNQPQNDFPTLATLHKSASMERITLPKVLKAAVEKKLAKENLSADPNIPCVTSLRSQFENVVKAETPVSDSSAKIFGPKPFKSSRTKNVDYGKTVDNNVTNTIVFKAKPIFVKVPGQKMDPVVDRRNLSPDSGLSSPKRSISPSSSVTSSSSSTTTTTSVVSYNTWRVKKDAIQGNVLHGAEHKAVGEALQNIYSKKLQNDGRQKAGEEAEICQTLKKDIVAQNQTKNAQVVGVERVVDGPLDEMKHFQFQIDLFSTSGDIIRLEKRLAL